MSGAAVITGIGIVSPLGHGAAFWPSLLEGALPPARVPAARAGVPVPRNVHGAGDLEAEHAVDPRALRKVSDLTRAVTVAASLCATDVALDGEARDETGVCLGTSFGSSAYHLDYHEALRRRGIRGASALLFTHSVFNAASGHVAQVLELRGSNLTLVGGEAVGLEAMQRAATRVRSGAELMSLAGGAEQYSDLVHASLHQSGLVDGAAWGPLADGAALVAIEAPGRALERGVRPYASMLGAGSARGLAGEPTLAAAAAAACARSGCAMGDVDLVITCPRAGGGAVADVAASAALGTRYVALPTLQIGLGFAFTSALAVAIGALALRDGVVPPTLPQQEGRWALPRKRCPQRALPARLERVLVLASTSANTAAALVLARFDAS